MVVLHEKNPTALALIFHITQKNSFPTCKAEKEETVSIGGIDSGECMRHSEKLWNSKRKKKEEKEWMMKIDNGSWGTRNVNGIARFRKKINYPYHIPKKMHI